MADADAPRRTDTAPCVGCGLCCDGTIYWRANAQPEERQRLVEAGLEVGEKEDKHWFVHPCRFSSKGLCTIYDQQRFNVCHTFRCKLLISYQAGEVTLDHARETIGKAVGMRTALVEEEPAARHYKERQALRGELESAKARPKVLLKIAALDYFLDKWFRP